MSTPVPDTYSKTVSFYKAYVAKSTGHSTRIPLTKQERLFQLFNLGQGKGEVAVCGSFLQGDRTVPAGRGREQWQETAWRPPASMCLEATALREEVGGCVGSWS